MSRSACDLTSQAVEEDVPQWYFSYGANMSPDVLRQRGVTTIVETTPGYLPSHHLSFDLIGFDGVEPRFANIVENDSCCECVPVHGVAHRLSASDLTILDRCEDAGVCYERIQLPFMKSSGSMVSVWAYCGMHSWICPGLPSMRYLHLLQKAARLHELPKAYCDWLSSHASLDFRSAAAVAVKVPLYAPEPGGPLDFSHQPGDTLVSECTPLQIAGKVFYIPHNILAQRDELREMIDLGGTRFILGMLSRAFPETATSTLPLQEEDFDTKSCESLLSELQWAYVRCWLRYFEAHYEGSNHADPRPE